MNPDGARVEAVCMDWLTALSTINAADDDRLIQVKAAVRALRRLRLVETLRPRPPTSHGT